MLIKVMTFNIRGAFAEDGVNAWPERVQLNVRLIQRYAPDLLGVQEMHQANLETYRLALAAYDVYLGQPYDFQDRPAYNAIFWRKPRLSFLEGGSFYLSQTPETAWSLGWDAALPRTAVWAIFNHRETNETFLLMNTHLDHIGPQARRESGKLLRAQMKLLCRSGLPAILTGDFNANAWHGPAAAPDSFDDNLHDSFLLDGYQDCYLAAGLTDSLATYTFHAYQGAAYNPANFHQALRIDWILTHGGRDHIQTHDCRIIRDADPPRYPSDHYPLLANLTIHFQPKDQSS